MKLGMTIVPQQFLVSSALCCLLALGVTTLARGQTTSKPNRIRQGVAATKTIRILPERQAKVYVGSSDFGGLPTAWEELANPDNSAKWSYVRTHADGFYTNFAMMDHVFAHGANPLQMAVDMANCFTRKEAFYETDMNYPEAQDKRNIACLTSGGFKVPVTSLNYGISAERVQTLKNYQGKRDCLALMGPWTLGGNILGDARGNSELRKNIRATDGMSADSPLRLWYNNELSARDGLYSTVTFTNQLNKTSAVMLAPPDSNDRPGYGGPSFLQSSQMMVFDLEDHGAVPAIWGVYPYGALKSLATFPESVVNAEGDTIAPDTKTGVAYWLIKHFNTLPKVTLPSSGAAKTGVPAIQKNGSHALVFLGKGKQGAQCTMSFVISNGFAPGIAISPVMRAILRNGEDWDIHFKLRGKNVTDAMVFGGGFNFIGDARISKKNPSTLQVTIRAKKRTPKPVTIELQTMSNISSTVHKETSFTTVAKV